MAACSKHTMYLWVLITICVTLAHNAALATPVDTKPKLTVRNTSYLSLNGTADHFRNAPNVVQTIQILFNPFAHGSTGNVNGGSMHKGVNYSLNIESDTAFATGNKLPVTVDTHKQTRISMDTETKVLATLESSGIHPSSYLITTTADFHISGSVKTRSIPWLELKLFSFDEKTVGSYFVHILYLNNTVDANMSVWKSNELAFTSEASLPKQVHGFTMTTGKGSEVVCSYIRQHGEIILQISILLEVQIFSTWEKEKALYCREGFICHTRNVNASHLSLHVHGYLEDSLVNASNLKCSVVLEKNGIRMLKSPEDEQKINQNEQNTHQSRKEGSDENNAEADQVIHTRSGLSATAIAVITVLIIFVITCICVLVVWKIRCTQSWTVEQSAPQHGSIQCLGIQMLSAQTQSNTNTSSAAKFDTAAEEPLINAGCNPEPATIADCSGSSEAANATLLDNKVTFPTRRELSKVEIPNHSDDHSEEAVNEEIPSSVRRSLVIPDSTRSNSTSRQTVVETEFGIVAEDES